MKAPVGVIFGGALTLALVAGGIVSAQIAAGPHAEPAPSALAAPRGPDANTLPPEETAPAKLPDAPSKTGAKPDAKRAAEKPDNPDASADDSSQAKESDAEDKPAATPAGDVAKRESHSVAVVQALDKITAETMRFEVRTGVPVRWKGLVFTLRACQTSAPNEPIKDSVAWIQVRSDPRAQSAEASREVFRGWMFASAPGVNPLQHPVYDAWLIACKA